MKKTPSPALIISILALFVALSGTTYAAVTINGKNIKKGSIAGNKLKKNTITGTQVKESKLGRVPLATRADLANQADNAAKVGGADLSNLVQGGGHVYSGNASTTSGTNDVSVLSVPGLGTLRFDCAGNGIDSTPEFVNASGDSIALLGSTQYRSGGGDLYKVDPNIPAAANGSTTAFTDRSIGNGTFQAWKYAGGGVTATVTYSSIFCSYSATAVVNN